MRLNIFYYLAALAFILPSCALTKAKSFRDVEVTNYDETKDEVDETEIYYASRDKEARGEGFIKIEEPTFSAAGHEQVIIKVERPGYLTQYYYVPKMKNKGKYVDYGISAGFLAAGAAYVANINNIGDDPGFAIIGAVPVVGSAIAGSIIFLSSGLRYKEMNVGSVVLPSEKRPFPEKTEEDKYMFINEVEFDLVSFSEKEYKSIKEFELDSPSKSKVVDEELKDDFPVSNILNKVLYDQGFIDTVNLIPNSYNSVYLDVSIKDIVFHEVDDTDLTSVEFEIEWEIVDFLTKSEVFTYTTNYKSPLLFNNNDLIEEYIKNILTESFAIFTNAPETQEYIEAEEDNTEEMELIDINSSKPVSTYGKAIQASVTIKVDEGHGSGFVVSDDGYIITNLHVVGNTETYTVIFNDEREMDAELIRVSRKYDLALLKIDADSLASIRLPAEEFLPNKEVGKDVYVIGTPNSIQLGQTVSRGILSGVRTFNDLVYLQTDAKINSGNSGGPIVDDEGNLLGVSNAKLIGIGVEGIGFGIPASVLKEALQLNFIYSSGLDSDDSDE
ncbi:MAG: hypothetical protein COA32_00135 [Fluviicola sp.]|nr:MAG: hypothetical protein COA32_00135 [Fluviicola sp.]